MLYGLMLCMLFGLLGFLWNLQVVRGSQFTSDITRQSVRRVRLPELRGKIYDRNDIVLADNRPSHCIGIYIEELREPPPRSRTIDRVEGIIQEISVILEMTPVVKRRDIERHTIERLPLPLLAFRDLDELSIARFAERVEGYPGVEIYTEAVRDYAFGPLAAHSIGYVGRGGMGGPEEEPYHYYLPQMEGKAGIERSMDKELRGEAGGELIRVDVSGFRHEVIGSRKPRNGKDLQLTIDTRIQKICESVLEGGDGCHLS